MKIPSIYKKLQVAGAATILVLGMSLPAAASQDFIVDPNGAFGGPQNPFQADFITGNSSTLLTLNADHQTATGSGWVNFLSFVDNGSNVLGSVSGLNNNWQMWAEFSYTLQLTSGTYAAVNSTYNVTGLHANFWVDPSIATATTFTQSTHGGDAATVTHGADSFQFAYADLLVGVANINSLGGTSFNSTTDFALTDAGNHLFVDPVPFYKLSFNEFNNTSGGVFLTANYTAINQTSGGFDFAAPIPEPETYAMLLVGLGLLGWKLRRA